MRSSELKVLSSASGLLDGAADGAAIGVLAALLRERQFEAAAQPGERASEVVGDVVADLAHAGDQLGDAVEHVVEVGGQAVELVVGAARRDSPVEGAGHDFPAGLVDRVDAAQHGPADQHAARDAQHQRQRDPPADRLAEPGVDLQPLPDVAPDQKAEPAGQLEDAGAAEIDGAAPIGVFELEGHPAVGAGFLPGPGAEVSGDRPEAGIGQQIEPAARPRPRCPAVEGAHQAESPELGVLLAEPADLGLDRLVGLARHEAGGGPVEETDQHHRRHPEQPEIDQGQAERRAAQQPSPHFPPRSWSARRCPAV